MNRTKAVSHLFSWSNSTYKICLLRDVNSSDHTNQSHTKKTNPQKKNRTNSQSTLYIMHYQTILVALFATAALAKAPWVSSFYNADCTSNGAGDAVNIILDNCVIFDSKYDAVAVNFGTSLEEITSLNVYSDANCTVFAGPAITSSMADGTPQQCISQSKHGAKWGSVMQNSN